MKRYVIKRRKKFWNSWLSPRWRTNIQEATVYDDNKEVGLQKCEEWVEIEIRKKTNED